jgi:hypothetical protein
LIIAPRSLSPPPTPPRPSPCTARVCNRENFCVARYHGAGIGCVAPALLVPPRFCSSYGIKRQLSNIAGITGRRHECIRVAQGKETITHPHSISKPLKPKYDALGTPTAFASWPHPALFPRRGSCATLPTLLQGSDARPKSRDAVSVQFPSVIHNLSECDCLLLLPFPRCDSASRILPRNA